MDSYYSGAVPNLLNNKTLDSLNKVVTGEGVNMLTQQEHLSNIYDEYIAPNMIFFILIGLFILYLAYMFYAKQNEDFTVFRPSFNPSVPVNKQQTFVDYLPDNDRVNSYVKPQKQVYKLEPPPSPPKHDHDFDYTGLTSDYYPTGNEFNEANFWETEYADPLDNNKLTTQDPDISMKYMYPVNFNSSTGSAVNYMTMRNYQNQKEFDKITDPMKIKF